MKYEALGSTLNKTKASGNSSMSQQVIIRWVNDFAKWPSAHQLLENGLPWGPDLGKDGAFLPPSGCVGKDKGSKSTPQVALARTLQVRHPSFPFPSPLSPSPPRLSKGAGGRGTGFPESTYVTCVLPPGRHKLCEQGGSYQDPALYQTQRFKDSPDTSLAQGAQSNDGKRD